MVTEPCRAPRVRFPDDPHRIGRSLIVEDHPSWQRRFSVTSAVPTRDSSPRCDGSSSASRTWNPSLNRIQDENDALSAAAQHQESLLDSIDIDVPQGEPALT